MKYFIKEMLKIKALILITMSINANGQKITNENLFKNDLKFYHFNTSDGLSNNMINSIEQDSMGFIWIATQAGLNRYDGREFKNFTKENSSLTDSYIQQAYISDSGELYLATNSGISQYQKFEQNFNYIRPDSSTLSNSITSITKFQNNKFLIGDYTGGLHILENNKERKIIYQGKRYNSILSDYRISTVKASSDTVIWAGTYSNGSYKIELDSTNSVKKITKITTKRTNAIFIDSKRNIWIGSEDGVHIIQNSKNDTIHLKKQINQLNDDVVKCVAEDKKGHIWIGTRNGGINIIDIKTLFTKKTPLTIKYFNARNDGSSVYHRDITALKCDAGGNMWIGTGAGFDFVNPSGEQFTLLTTKLKNSSHLSNERITALSESFDKKIWIGTDGAGLNLYHPENGKIDNHPLPPDAKLSNNFVISLLEDSDKNLWIGTYRGGLNKYNFKTRVITHYLQGDISRGSDVRTIFQDKNNTIWVGTNRGGLYKYNSKTDTFQYIKVLGKIDIREIEQQNTNELWLATYGNGIIKYHIDKEEYTSYNNSNTNIPTNVIFSFEFIDENNILAGTMNEGMFILDITTKTAKIYTKSDGLSNNTISSITKDSEDLYWIGTYKGITMFNPINKEIKDLKNFNAIQNSEFNIGASLFSSNGVMYMGGNEGINIFRPEALQNIQQKTFNTVFKNLDFYNKSVTVSDSTQQVLDKAIQFKDTLKIDYNQALFSLDFASLQYPRSDNIEYSYLLEGYSDHWVNIKNANRINFSHLPPGNYKLILKTNPNDYVTSSKELYISIMPPFWRTIPAYISYFIIISLLIVFGLKYYSDKIKLKQSLVFEKNQRQLENELHEERLRFYNGFSHELKTPLTMILAPVESLLTEIRKKEQINSLRIIEKNAKTLLTRINKLLDFRQVEKGLNELKTDKHDLKVSIEKWITQYKHVADAKKINIQSKFDCKQAILFCDIEKIQIIFNNLITNALKYTAAQDTIKIILKTDKNGYQFSVTDTGSGIPAHILPHIFDWYYHSDEKHTKNGSGIGLALSKQFVELHGGKITAESIENEHTTFTIYLPKGEEKTSEKNIDFKYSEFEGLTTDLLNEEASLENRALLNTKAGRKLILLIDDNTDIHQYLASILKEKYDLLHALNGQEGINMAVKHIPDLIISDVMMPEKSGIDLTSALKNQEETTHIPIILLSAKDTQEAIIDGYQEGADDYITKPFSSSVLIARIQNLLYRKLEVLEKGITKDTNENPKCQQISLEKEFLLKFETTVYEYMQSQGKIVELISEKMGMSRATLYRKIKGITGKNITQHIRDIRLEKALSLIQFEGLTISQAAFEVGFNNPKYFRKIFKEKYGDLPSNYTLNRDLT
ncbi:hybrid sensor histidine kinase/response regulator transcription factor [Zunongwangia sp.]|uniref:hybrid sensor histidine kinase/response regulator transcription factor n=1 Tax=Zunongwangia sp. TaxID=1965325 RepID=UPI003AA8353F